MPVPPPSLALAALLCGQPPLDESDSSLEHLDALLRPGEEHVHWAHRRILREDDAQVEPPIVLPNRESAGFILQGLFWVCVLCVVCFEARVPGCCCRRRRCPASWQKLPGVAGHYKKVLSFLEHNSYNPRAKILVCCFSVRAWWT